MKFLCNFHLKFKEVYIMAQSICPKCGNSQFEGVEKRIVGLRYSVMFIQCMSCGCVVGVLNFSPQGFVIRAEGLCGFQIRSYITRGLTNCLPPSRLGITQTSLVLLSLLRRLQIPVNMKLA